MWVILVDSEVKVPEGPAMAEWAMTSSMYPGKKVILEWRPRINP